MFISTTRLTDTKVTTYSKRFIVDFTALSREAYVSRPRGITVWFTEYLKKNVT